MNLRHSLTHLLTYSLTALCLWLIFSPPPAHAQLRFVRYCTNAVDLVAVNPNSIDLISFVKDLGRFYFYDAASAVATNTPSGPFKPDSFAGRWLEISLGVAAGITINPSDNYLPYRINATTFGDSPLQQNNTASTGTNVLLTLRGSTTLTTGDKLFAVWNNSTERAWITPNGNGVFGRTVMSGTNTPTSFSSADYSFASMHDTDKGDDSFNTWFFGANNTAGTHGSYVQGYASDSATVPENSLYSSSFAGGLTSAWTLRSGGNWGRSVFDMNVRGREGISFRPDSATSSTVPPFRLNYVTNIVQQTNLFELRHNLTNQFSVAPISGWTGAGTLFLSDDGTYKTAGGGGTTINPTDNRIPYRASSTTFGDSPWHYIGGDTNALGFNGTDFFLRSNLEVGKESLGLGHRALNARTTAQFTTAFGHYAGAGNTTGDYNTFMGFEASTNTVTGDSNEAVGFRAQAKLTSGVSNTAVGTYALEDNTDGNENVAIGQKSLRQLNDSSTGHKNTALGVEALFSALAGTANTAVGFRALSFQTNATKNVAVGAYAGETSISGTSGSRNTFVGYGAGTNNVAGNDLVYIGMNARGSGTGSTNAIAIGAGVVAASNTAQIGTNGVSVLYLNGTVGWFRGTGTPEAAVTAPVGSFFTREDGGSGTSFYVKESGTGNTGWVAK